MDDDFFDDFTYGIVGYAFIYSHKATPKSDVKKCPKKGHIVELKIDFKLTKTTRIDISFGIGKLAKSLFNITAMNELVASTSRTHKTQCCHCE